MGRAQRGADRRRTGWKRAAKLAGLGALVIPLTTGCSVEEVLRFGWPEGVTPQARAMQTFWTWSAVAALIVGAITWGAMFWAVAFHRKRKGDDDTPPRQTQYNLPVELVFTIVPTIIVAVLFGFTVNVQNYVDRDEPNPDVRVAVTAFQWNWRFDYTGTSTPAGGPIETLGTSSTIPVLVLPTDRSVEFTLESEDVVHSFWVPEFLFKRDVFPVPDKNDTDKAFVIDKIDREGAFVGRCAELCGAYHSAMNFEVRAIEPALYDRYIGLRSQVNPATGAPYTNGEALAALDCGEWCAPEAITTYPFATDRTQRSASLRTSG
ncbi:aa3-type cytochrome oxidase subunit II [Pseudonocardia asaccharolytica]|uniref:cytochrome-c oxidase n=1 Tax=Pseudonocardia asaccharolytica DSM 44247 = NBRC 16224 TaxID=1123024 RepID=A0A511D2A0_9PSEU|nr:cytochrome c oxidase subunit II [Pseudonocardia asaccharolytica]GEL18912.1 cytochrome c oxidase subunit II [Pseudonocardia asaccharolytica DSM 44247 = NBRC 16224]